MKRNFLMAVLLGATVLPHVEIAAQKPTTQDRPFKVYFYGSHSCGEWLEERRVDPALPGGNVNLQGLSYGKTMWLLGWVSAAGKYVPLKYTDQASIKAWVDQYCTANPLNGLSEAAVALVEALREK